MTLLPLFLYCQQVPDFTFIKYTEEIADEMIHLCRRHLDWHYEDDKRFFGLSLWKMKVWYQEHQ
jgi:hypothetical protein